MKALTFIGDAPEEQIDELAGQAGHLGALGVPIFMFQEGHDAGARKVFRLLALRMPLPLPRPRVLEIAANNPGK